MKRKIVFLLLNVILFPASGQVNLQSSNLPIIIIDTQNREIVDEPKITATLQIIDNSNDVINNITDSSYNYDGYIGIELRGSSSRTLFDKKSFGIETRDEDGQGINTSLAGLPEEEDWVLYAPYSDKSLMRNVLAYKLGRDMGRYASRTRFCELILNNSYHGIYIIMEKIKRDSVRVDIAKLNPDENSGDDLTGGYIIKLDKFDGGNSGDGWNSPYKPLNRTRVDQEIYFQYDYPKGDEITIEQKNYIKNYVTDFESDLHTGDIVAFKKHVDYGSFIDYALINELTRNVDGYRLSTFLHKDKDSKEGKITLGPIWDFNLAFGNADYCNGSDINGWAWDFNRICNDDYWLIPFWWDKLLERNSFWIDLKNRWNELREGPFSEENIMYFIDSTSVEIEEARIRNFQRWQVLNQYIWPNQYVGTDYISEINYLKNWISGRLGFMDAQFALLTAVEEDEISPNGLLIYPNPSRNNTTLSLSLEQPGFLEIAVFDLNGREIRNLWKGFISENHLEINWDDISNLNQNAFPGMYILRIKIDNNLVMTEKIIRL